MSRFRLLPLILLLSSSAIAQEAPSDPCEPQLASSTDRPAWPCVVVDVPSGDTLIVQLRDFGRRRIRLAGLRAPQGGDSMAVVSRFHLARIAKGLRTFVVLDLPAPWPEEVVAPVEDFTEAQLTAGMGRYVAEEQDLLGPYLSCRCLRAEERARQGRVGVWKP